MSSSARELLVVGAGVSGLSCGVALVEAGFRARIVARELWGESVSSVAAALWLPYLVEPLERVLGWARTSLAAYREIARDASSGVRLVPGVQVGPLDAPPEWCAIEGIELRPARRDELPPGHAEGFAFVVPVIDTARFLPYLAARFERAGGRIERGAFRSLDEALERAPLVVNASGLGARELAGDRSMFPIRGQVACVARGAAERILLDERDPACMAYVIPRGRDVVLGGVAEVGREELEPEEATTRAILERCVALEPRLAAAEVLRVKVGLRPGRPSVRLELEQRARGIVIHDYGHGGAGVTLATGCAAEVVELARQFDRA